MHHIIEYIKQKYDPCSIILYGSYADGTNNLNSDFDALVLSYNYDQFHDTSFVNGVQLDLFVYPVSYFDEARPASEAKRRNRRRRRLVRQDACAGQTERRRGTISVALGPDGQPGNFL